MVTRSSVADIEIPRTGDHDIHSSFQEDTLLGQISSPEPMDIITTSSCGSPVTVTSLELPVTPVCDSDTVSDLPVTPLYESDTASEPLHGVAPGSDSRDMDIIPGEEHTLSSEQQLADVWIIMRDLTPSHGYNAGHNT